MYKLLLILKYLRRKLAPMFAAVAVMLCTMMVIIVISVMGGFLTLLQDAARKLTGDVTVLSRSLTGFPHYEDLITRLEALPEVEIATPLVQAYALLNLDRQTRGVQVQGIVPEDFDQIVEYRDTLLWSRQDLLDEIADTYEGRDLAVPELRAEYENRKAWAERTDPVEAAMRMRVPSPWDVDAGGNPRQAMVIGVEVSPFQQRDEQGQYDFRESAFSQTATLTIVPLTESGTIRDLSPSYGQFTVVNEFKSGLFDVDSNVVFVPFEALQRLLKMEPRTVHEEFDPETGEPIGEPVTRPGRVNEVVVKGAPGFSLAQVRAAVAAETDAWSEQYLGLYPPAVLTWEERHASLLSAVRNETGLVTFLFAIISVVAVVMVATTFYMIVLEKTRDIGVLRAIGASAWGILGMFLGYGFAIGVVGSVTGLAIAVFIVTHLNELQDVLAARLGTLLLWAALAAAAATLAAAAGYRWGRRHEAGLERGLLAFLVVLLGVIGLAYTRFDLLDLDALDGFNASYGWRMWDPQTYFFDRIPDRVNPTHAGLIVAFAIVSSVVGALVPAFLASRQNPIEALRYE